MLLHRDAFHKDTFSTQTFAHTNALTLRSFCTKNIYAQVPLHRLAFTQEELLQTVTQDHAGTSTHRCLYTGMLLRRNAFKHVLLHRGSFDAEYPVHTEAFPYAHTNTLTQKGLRTKIHSYSCDFKHRSSADTYTKRCFSKSTFT